MWDRSYQWQKNVRSATGVGVLLLLLGCSVLLVRTSAARRTREGARDLLSEILSPDRQLIEVNVPAELQAQVGTLVYRERQDGVAQVIGRVVVSHAINSDEVALAIRLSGTLDAAHRGGILRGAPAELSLRDAVQLLVSPNTPSEEALKARDRIWPSIRGNVLPRIMDGLIREISAELANPGAEDAELLRRLVTDLHARLEPLENDLVNRLAKRAWDIVGVQGLAGGTPSPKPSEEKTEGVKLSDLWSWMTRTEVKTDARGRPFLSEKTSRQLKIALDEEVVQFWTENRAHIVAAFEQSVEQRRDDFALAFEKRWSGLLYDRVIMPAWQAGQAEVMASIEAYVSDFANRRLLTSQGGPRLLFAFILRSYLDISDAPLLVLAQGTSDLPDHVVYEPLLK
jgi:hypothetical protein